MTKQRNAEAGHFGIHNNLSKFLTTFNSKRNKRKYQCFNCGVWKSGHLLTATFQFDQMTKEIFGFRFCSKCWKSYQDVSPELKKEFIENIRRKIQTASEVKINA